MQNSSGGKKPDYNLTEKKNNGSYEIVGAAWINESKNGNKYISISMNNGAKFSMFKNTPKPQNTQQQGYQQASYGQRQNQQPQHISQTIPDNSKDIEW